MPAILKTKIVKIGNSRGIRIPKPLLTSAGIEGEVEIVPQEGSLLIKPVKPHPRAGWEEQFELMHQRGDDRLEDWPEYLPTKFDEEEWEW